MTDFPRLIEFAFPLKQTSLDSVHEKNVRHGHISTLHIWPARRPLAACRAALIATLLPDPGDAEKRKELCEKIGGKVVKKIERKKMPNGQIVERVKEETEGGILHWGRETENAETLEWFRQEIKKAYGGRAPKVLDPFAGGGAIPLEAMRLGCEATAVDINPVAWFILKCTLEYPQKLAGQTRPLPGFILHDDAFMAEFFAKAKGYSKAEVKAAIKRLHESLKKTAKWNKKADQGHFKFENDGGDAADEVLADLAWHVRAWGNWVLGRARRELAQYYPTYADFEPIKKDQIAYEPVPMRLVPLRDDGVADIDALNAEFTADYLADTRNPRWVAKPTVAYLWARTVTCKNCRATVPLLKTRWLCKKDSKRTLLTLEPNLERTGVIFGIEENVPLNGGNAAQRREHDKRLGVGTMSRAGARCVCCPAIMTMEDIRVRGKARELATQLTAVVTDTSEGRHYRLPTQAELSAEDEAAHAVEVLFASIPFGVIAEPLYPESTRSISCHLYGIDSFGSVFTPRQQFALGTLVRHVRQFRAEGAQSLHPDWQNAIFAALALGVDRVADRMSVFCQPDPSPTQSGVMHTFARFSFSMVWDFIEAVPHSNASGGFAGSLEWIALAFAHFAAASAEPRSSTVLNASAAELRENAKYDVVFTDPPYYQAISYADLSDYFYVWLRRLLDCPEFRAPLSDKSKEIVQHIRADKDRKREKQKYEDGMAAAFEGAYQSLTDNGRFVIVFAHKDPDAWETLVAAMIRAGFVVTASWPIETERGARTRAISSASLASSVWLVCKKRPVSARPGWDNTVMQEMRRNIAAKLREFWDAGIRGPDFVWAATGPALEAYSKHPVVRKANEANATMGVGEFLAHVRRMVVDYIVGQVLSGERGADLSAADRLDEVTAYYLLHRHDFGMDDAPVGACILYATACGLSDAELEKTWDVLATSGKGTEYEENAEDDGPADEDSEADDTETESSGGSKVKLKAWSQRRGKSLGYEAPQGKAVPLIDRIHRVMHLWKEGDLHKVDEYLDQHALRRHELFKRVVQSLVELSNNSERSLLESISNHIGAKGAKRDDLQRSFIETGPAAESEEL
jgi:putative DNA methylase